MQHNPPIHFRENTVPLSLRDAAVRPATFNPTALTVECVVATDAGVRRVDASGTEFLEILSISGADLTVLRGASVLNSHMQHGLDNVLGTVEEAWREANAIVARIRLSSRTEVAPIVEDIRAGILASVSVGYEVTQWEESRGANGVMVRTAVAWKPREVSFVPVPADPAARTRNHSPTPPQGNSAQMRQLAYRAGIPAETVDRWIDNGWSMDQARGAILDNMIVRGSVNLSSAHNASTFDNPDFATRAIGDALYARMSGTAPAGAAREFMHRSAIDLMRETLRISGVPLRGQSDADVVRGAMLTRSVGGGLHTTFPTLLTDTANRRLGELFRAAESGASAIIATLPADHRGTPVVLPFLGAPRRKRRNQVGHSRRRRRGARYRILCPRHRRDIPGTRQRRSKRYRSLDPRYRIRYVGTQGEADHRRPERLARRWEPSIPRQPWQSRRQRSGTR